MRRKKKAPAEPKHQCIVKIGAKYYPTRLFDGRQQALAFAMSARHVVGVFDGSQMLWQAPDEPIICELYSGQILIIKDLVRVESAGEHDIERDGETWRLILCSVCDKPLRDRRVGKEWNLQTRTCFGDRICEKCEKQFKRSTIKEVRCEAEEKFLRMEMAGAFRNQLKVSGRWADGLTFDEPFVLDKRGWPLQSKAAA